MKQEFRITVSAWGPYGFDALHIGQHLGKLEVWFGLDVNAAAEAVVRSRVIGILGKARPVGRDLLIADGYLIRSAESRNGQIHQDEEQEGSRNRATNGSPRHQLRIIHRSPNRLQCPRLTFGAASEAAIVLSPSPLEGVQFGEVREEGTRIRAAREAAAAASSSLPIA